MTQTTAYSVDTFIDDVREIFDTTQDALAQASGVAKHMERLLATPGWLEERLELPDEGAGSAAAGLAGAVRQRRAEVARQVFAELPVDQLPGSLTPEVLDALGFDEAWLLLGPHCQ